jgi:hypothetical protein
MVGGVGGTYFCVNDRLITKTIYIPAQIIEDKLKAIYVANAVIQGFH